MALINLAFYLVDFKKGVEFKTYANAQLPHAKVIAVESDREYALSVLRHIDSELERRGSVIPRPRGAGFSGVPQSTTRYRHATQPAGDRRIS